MTSSPISLPSSPTRHKSLSALPSPGPPMVRPYSLVSPTTSSGSGSSLLRDHVDYEFTCEDIIVLVGSSEFCLTMIAFPLLPKTPALVLHKSSHFIYYRSYSSESESSRLRCICL